MFGRRYVAVYAFCGACLVDFGATASETPTAADGTNSNASSNASSNAKEPAAENGAAAGPEAGESTVDPAAKQRAKQLYEDGLSAYRAGNYSGAIDKLLEADQAMPNAAFSYNIAVVYEAMGDHRSALRWLRNFLRQSDHNADESETLKRVRKFEAELQAKGLQQVTIISKPTGAALKIDGQPVGIAPFTTEITPGRHQASLQLDGYELAQQTFDLRPDRSMDLDVDLVPARVVSPTPVAETTPLSTAPVLTPNLTSTPFEPSSATQPERRSTGVRPLTWISLGVGAALLGGATVFEFQRRSAEDRAKDAAQTDYQSEWDKMDRAQTASRILAVAGSAVVATGLVLLTVDLTRSGPVQAATFGSCSSGGMCLNLRGQL